jgi:hypothetical protein
VWKIWEKRRHHHHHHHHCAYIREKSERRKVDGNHQFFFSSFIHLVEWRWCDTKYWLIFNDVVIASWSAMKKKMWNLNDIFWVRFSDSIYGWCVWWWWFHWCSAYFPPASIHSFSVIMCMWVCVCVWDFNFFLRKLLLFFFIIERSLIESKGKTKIFVIGFSTFILLVFGCWLTHCLTSSSEREKKDF